MTERIFHLRPAYDCIGVQPCVHGSESCIPGTGGSHGRHNAEMHLTVRGPDAEVTLVIGTGWDLPSVPDRYAHRGPTGRFVEFHTARPRYEDQSVRTPQPGDSCENWGACYVNSGYSMADEPTRLLVAKGSDAAWAWLENLYAETQAEMDKLTAVDAYDAARADFYRPVHLNGSGSDSSSIWVPAKWCTRCGVLVADTEVHDQWHQERS